MERSLGHTSFVHSTHTLLCTSVARRCFKGRTRPHVLQPRASTCNVLPSLATLAASTLMESAISCKEMGSLCFKSIKVCAREKRASLGGHVGSSKCPLSWAPHYLLVFGTACRNRNGLCRLCCQGLGSLHHTLYLLPGCEWPPANPLSALARSNGMVWYGMVWYGMV